MSTTKISTAQILSEATGNAIKTAAIDAALVAVDAFLEGPEGGWGDHANETGLWLARMDDLIAAARRCDEHKQFGITQELKDLLANVPAVTV